MPEQVSQSNPQRESYPRRLLRWIQTGWRTFNSAYDATGRAAKFLW